ncbi:hypothetical protein FI667_g9356, partial [Globisporangium splendens]
MRFNKESPQQMLSKTERIHLNPCDCLFQQAIGQSSVNSGKLQSLRALSLHETLMQAPSPHHLSVDSHRTCCRRRARQLSLIVSIWIVTNILTAGMVEHQQHFRGLLCADAKTPVLLATCARDTTLDTLTIEQPSDLRVFMDQFHGDKLFLGEPSSVDVALLDVDDTSRAELVRQLNGSIKNLDLLPTMEQIQDAHNPAQEYNAGPTDQLHSNELHSRNYGKNEHSAATTDAAETSKTPLQQKKKNQNLSRERQQQEIRSLRVMAIELEAQRKRLFGEYINRRPLPVRSEPTLTEDANLVHQTRQATFQRALALKRSAARARQDAERAKSENTRLRGLIGQQRQVTRTFSAELFGKRHQHTPSFRSFPADNSRVSVRKFPATPASLNCTTPPTRRLVVNVGMPPSGFGRPVSAIRHDLANTVEILLRDAFPDVDHSHQDRSSPSTPARLLVRIALRKYVEASRVVLVWSLAIEIDQDDRESIRFCGKRWSVLQHLGAHCDRADRNEGTSVNKVTPCLVQTCMRVIPLDNSSKESSDNNGSEGGVPKRIVAYYHQTRNLVNQLVENQLFDEHLQYRTKPKQG